MSGLYDAAVAWRGEEAPAAATGLGLLLGYMNTTRMPRAGRILTRT